VGQFAPKYPGQFAPKQWVSLRRNGVVSFIIISNRIAEFAMRHQLIPSPDEEGYFGFHSGYKMYIEILSFKKLLKDATLRNKVFFKKLLLE
jgi:hypothetical protein